MSTGHETVAELSTEVTKVKAVHLDQKVRACCFWPCQWQFGGNWVSPCWLCHHSSRIIHKHWAACLALSVWTSPCRRPSRNEREANIDTDFRIYANYRTVPYSWVMHTNDNLTPVRDRCVAALECACDGNDMCGFCFCVRR